MRTMGSPSEEEYPFFDACEDIASVSDDGEASNSDPGFDDHVGRTLLYDLWVNTPRSVKERRSSFFRLIGVEVDQDGENGDEVTGSVDRLRETNGAVLRESGGEDEPCCSHSTVVQFSGGISTSLDACFYRDGTAGAVMHDLDDVGREESSSDGCELGPEFPGAAGPSENSFSPSPHWLMKEQHDEPISTPRRFKKWLHRLRSIACAAHNQYEAEKLRNDDAPLSRVQRVTVHQSGKRMKELSALYMSQDIQAHSGSILTMKFSPDGQYLASAGMDGIVRLWLVVEDERSNELDTPEIDPSCIYFTVNHLSELKPHFLDKEKAYKLRSLRKTSDSACVMFPPKAFRILEKPLHEFRGHNAEILDLSWSTKNHLLSASVDKTIRLWRVGCDECLRVFSHSNYVTSVQFNPLDDNYFVSGSIDGKVRIWAISTCQVVDWTDAKDIITAICYRPDGQEVIVGSMEGNCRFYSMSDNHLQLDAQVCLDSKKKSPCKRITRFQFSPEDSTKVMVTCADSKVRVLQGHKVVTKYKGSKSASNLLSASFTLDGRHIISASEDSNVYVWNHLDQLGTTKGKTIKSCERFGADASMAIPWSGFRQRNSENHWGLDIARGNPPEVLRFHSTASFCLGQEYFLESFPKGSATWPEEKLPTSKLGISLSVHRSQFKFLKASCQNTATSHAWGLVIVTAGYDGRIRSFHNYGLPTSV